MKIIYVLSGTEMQGGATKSFLNLLKKVCECGHEALVVCPNRKGLFEYLYAGSVNGAMPVCLSYAYNALPPLRRASDYYKFIPKLLYWNILNLKATIKLIGIAKEFHPDLIHSNTSVNNIGYITARKLNIPHIWHIREYGKLDFNLVIPYQSKLLTSPDNYCISITKDIARYKKICNISSSTVIYNGIVSENELRYAETDDRYFLYAGRLTKNKGILDLIEAYSRYADSIGKKDSLPLLIAGDYHFNIRNKIENFSIEHKISEKVRLLGPREDIKDIMYHATATIVPSYNEGFGRVLPEAMANGCLTVGRNSGGTKEQYDNGRELTGSEIGYRFSDNEELASILLQISKYPKARFKEMIMNSQIVVRELYSIENYAKQVISLYKRILKSK